MDSRFNEWLFWYEDADGYRRPKQVYSDLVCAKCGKLDEVAAINRGIDPNITIRSKRDFIGTTDGFKVVTRRAMEAFGEDGIKGLRFIQLSDGNHSVLWPEVRVPTDLSKAGFEFEGPRCARCGRYRGAYVGPFSASLTVPDDPMMVFASEIWNEDWVGRVLWLFAQEPVAKALRLRRLTGLEIIKAN
jgi:hypothetical protein